MSIVIVKDIVMLIVAIIMLQAMFATNPCDNHYCEWKIIKLLWPKPYLGMWQDFPSGSQAGIPTNSQTYKKIQFLANPKP